MRHDNWKKPLYKTKVEITYGFSNSFLSCECLYVHTHIYIHDKVLVSHRLQLGFGKNKKKSSVKARL